VTQNNGRLAHQEVDHVHFHVIPKPNETEGLVFGPESWPSQKPSMDDLKAYHAELVGKLEAVGKL
jgi:diadenosine tetraphosphate (Ap4A) HIT family hydrolase